MNPYNFADDLNILAIAKTEGEIHLDLHAISTLMEWV